MKRCPTCNRTFTDRNLTFCVDDGTPLVTIDVPDEETVVSPHGGAAGQPPAANSPPVYQPPGTYVPPGVPGAQKRRVWPWIVGLLALFFIVVCALIIGAVIMIPRMNQRPVVTNTSNRNANVSSNENADQNNAANTNESLLGNTSPPTDEATVLADLTELEHQWTVANINADKTKLDRILADDYVGTTVDGQTQGKAEYLRTIERDTLTQEWEFDDLEVDLLGDRATLTGLVRFQIENKPREFRFVDKFVWRDGRWQATASAVTPVD